MAVAGLKPVVAIYSTFLQRAYDQILHDVALQNAPVVFALDRAGLVGDDGATHHGVFDMAYLRNIPNMVIMAPKDEDELGQMLESALSYNHPATIRFPRGSGLGVNLKEQYDILEIGKSEVLAEGKDIVLFAIGTMVHEAEKAAQLLEQKGITATVVNARFVKPLDESLIIRLARENRLFVTLEEGVLAGGFGSGVLEVLQKANCKIDTLCIGIQDEFVPHGATEILKEKCGLTAEKIYEKIISYRGVNNG